MPSEADTDAVLRILTQTSLGISPAGLAANIASLTEEELTEPTVEDALDDLHDRNLVETLDDTDYYRLSEHGRDYATTKFGENVFGYID